MNEGLTYVEIDVDYCSLTYGTAPCTAAVPTTGAQKCFNTRASCQDIAHFNNVPVTLRFSVDTGHNPTDIEALPFIRNHSDVSITPGRISLGEDLGQRESVSITFGEQPHSDTGPGFDKYPADRSYSDPYSQGSFWSKFRARQPYLKGRPLRVYRGFVGQALADMECRHYIIDSYQGPGVDGKYQLVAKDILKLLDGDIAQAPALSLGSLSADIASNAGSLTLTPTGIGSTYPASGSAAIGGNEIVSFTRSGDVMTITGHGLNGTAAAAHSAGDRVQLCLLYTAADPADIIYDLMLTYGGISSSYLPHSTWQTETGTFNRRLYTGIVAEPTSVRALIQEMIQQAGLAIWWDPVDQQVNLQVLRAVTADAQTFDETVMMGQDSLVISEQPDKRVSRVQVYFGQRNPLVQQDLPANYRSSLVVLDTTAETNYGTPAIQTIYSRWIAFGGLTTAERIGNLQLGRYVNPPRKFTFSTIRGEDGGLILGAGYYLENRAIQNFDGSRATVPIQITRDNSQADRHGYEAEENIYVSYDAADLLTVIIDANIRSINLRSIYDTLYTAPLAGDQITFVVNSGVVVGGAPAITVGTWPQLSITGNRTSGSPTISGISSTASLAIGMFVHGTGIPNRAKILSKTSNSITLDANATSGSSTSTSLTVDMVLITLTISGRVQGAGGQGGNGANGPAGIPGTGSAGSTALYTRYGINVAVGSGAELAGGGGGGGGAGTRVYGNHAGGGAGGGAGDPGGNGGNPGGTGPAQGGIGGSLDTPGNGGLSWTTNGGVFAQPVLMDPRGGNGGGPGQAGSSGGNSDSAGAAGGAAGNAIDGDSYVKLTNSGTIAGPQIN